MRTQPLIVVCAAMLALAGCKRQQASRGSSDYLDPSIERVHALGWLGGKAHPAPRSVKFNDKADETRVTGGMVITEVLAAGPLGQAGVQRGDVIVRVSEQWMPNKDDPSMDMIRSIEAEVSAGIKDIQLGILRRGALKTISIHHDQTAMEFGLPGPSERLGRMAESGLDRLVTILDDEAARAQWTNDETVATLAMAGLALLAGVAMPDDGPRGMALVQCRAGVASIVGDVDRSLDPWSTALATMFLAELSGPLQVTTVTHMIPAGGDGAAFTMSGLPPGASPEGWTSSGGVPDGAQVSSTVIIGGDGELPEGFDPSQLPGGGSSFVISGDDHALPEGIDLESLQGSGGFVVMDGVPGMPGMPAGGAGEGEPLADEPLWSLEQVSMLAGPDAATRLAPLQQAVDRLIAMQDERGSWDPDDDTLGFSRTTLLTNQAMMALGMAQRGGAPVRGAALREGLEYLRGATNDGHVYTVNEPGFDRREEAGRSSGAAAALLALNCDDRDEFLKELIDYSRDHAGGLPGARGAVPLHVLHSAVLSRQLGREAWAVFFEEFRNVLVGLQQPDGSFASLPTESDAGWPGRSTAPPALRTAAWTLVAALQYDRTPVLLASAEHPLQRKINSAGEMLAGGPGPAAPSMMMPGQPMDPEQAREMLEKMGIDLDEVMNNSVQTGGPDDE